jgi:sRNA-binding carbon storage regulator CsrA
MGYELLQRFRFYYVYYVIFEFDRDYMYTYNVSKDFKNQRIYRMLTQDLKRLVLARREGETLLIADDRVQYIGMSAAGTALVLINGERVQLEVNYSYPIKNYYIRLMSSPYADKNPQIKIAIIAPPSVVVLRKELLGRRRRV